MTTLTEPTPIFDALATEHPVVMVEVEPLPLPTLDLPWVRDDSVLIAAGHQSPTMFTDPVE